MVIYREESRGHTDSKLKITKASVSPSSSALESEFIVVSADRMHKLLLDMVHVHDPDFMDIPISLSINVIFIS